jgi:hypothetical protein
MQSQSFTGSSKSRSLEEAVKDALSQITSYCDSLPGADILVSTKLASIRFQYGGMPGLDILEVDFILE